jgi:hypothetical protein
MQRKIKQKISFGQGILIVLSKLNSRLKTMGEGADEIHQKINYLNKMYECGPQNLKEKEDLIKMLASYMKEGF